ncbi:hypothetical protein Aperf_G00000001106 [Anoplocephala perfoliata]
MFVDDGRRCGATCSKFASSPRYTENVLKYLLNVTTSKVPLVFEYAHRIWSSDNSQVTWLISCQPRVTTINANNCTVTGYNLSFRNSADSIFLGTFSFDVESNVAKNKIIRFYDMLWYNATAVVTRSAQNVNKLKLFGAIIHSLKKAIESAKFIIS